MALVDEVEGLVSRHIRKNNVKEQISFSFDCCPTMKTLLEGIKNKKIASTKFPFRFGVFVGPLHYYFAQSGFLRFRPKTSKLDCSSINGNHKHQKVTTFNPGFFKTPSRKCKWRAP